MSEYHLACVFVCCSIPQLVITRRGYITIQRESLASFKFGNDRYQSRTHNAISQCLAVLIWRFPTNSPIRQIKNLVILSRYTVDSVISWRCCMCAIWTAEDRPIVHRTMLGYALYRYLMKGLTIYFSKSVDFEIPGWTNPRWRLVCLTSRFCAKLQQPYTLYQPIVQRE